MEVPFGEVGKDRRRLELGGGKFETLLDIPSGASNTKQAVRGTSLVQGESWAGGRNVGAVGTESFQTDK